MEVAQESVRIHLTVLEAIRSHGKLEDAKGGYEAVGMIAKRPKDNVGIATVRLNNHSPEPQDSFFVEMWEQFRAEQTLEKNGYELMGLYHSHVRAEALPSQSDHKHAWPGGLVLIYSVVFDDLRAYRQKDGFLYPIEIKEA